MPATAIVLCNLGGPDSLSAVEPFLFNLFSDPDIFRLPLARVTQRPFARWLSARRRDEAARGYEAIGGASPILAHTTAQAVALERLLAGTDTRVFVCMRYWHPLTSTVVEHLRRERFERVVVLPLYPQFSAATTGSAHNEFRRQCARLHYSPDVSFVGSWYQEPDYLEAVARSIEGALVSLPTPDERAVSLLLSAHGLPRKAVERGDPYQREIEATAAALSRRLNWPCIRLCYQSRVGPLEWLRPYTDDTIRAEAQAGAKQMLVYPIAFVSDHVETLYELGITYAKLAKTAGIDEYRVVPALNDAPLLISALAKTAQKALEGGVRP